MPGERPPRPATPFPGQQAGVRTDSEQDGIQRHSKHWLLSAQDGAGRILSVSGSAAAAPHGICEEIKLPNLPFGLETAIYMFPFFALGKVIGSVKDEFTRKSILVKIAVTVGCLAVGTFMTIGNGQVSYNADSYGTHGFGYFLVMAIMLCVGFVSLAMCFPNGVTPINYVGRNTVGIMVMHPHYNSCSDGSE